MHRPQLLIPKCDHYIIHVGPEGELEGPVAGEDQNLVVEYTPQQDRDNVTLNGYFTIAELEAIVTHMKQWSA